MCMLRKANSRRNRPDFLSNNNCYANFFEAPIEFKAVIECRKMHILIMNILYKKVTTNYY